MPNHIPTRPQLEELRTESIKMRSKLRHLEQESPYAEMFSSYEREQERLSKEVRRLLNENVALEEKLLEKNLEREDAKRNNGRVDSGTAMRKALHDAKSEIKDLKVSNMALKRQERYRSIPLHQLTEGRASIVQQHALESASKRTQQLTK